MAKASQRQFLVSVSGISGFFATKSGGTTTSEASEVWDGGARTPERLASPPATENVTVSRPFDPIRDRPVIRELLPQIGVWRGTVSVQDTDADLVPLGPPTVYSNALLVRVAEPEVDAASGDAATFELEFAVESVA